MFNFSFHKNILKIFNSCLSLILFFLFSILPVASTISSTSLASLKEQEQNIKQRYFSALSQYGPYNKMTIDLCSKLADLQDKIKDSEINSSISRQSYTINSNALKALHGTWQADLALANLFTMQGNLAAADELFMEAFEKAAKSGYTKDQFKQAGFILMEELIITSNTNSAATPPPVSSVNSNFIDQGRWAQSFNENSIIPDKVLTNSKSMTSQEVQNFLETKNSVLAKPYNGQYPSQLIINTAEKYNINPMVILATLQKEQGLISKKTASTHTLDWALGVGCYDSGNWNQKYKGFEKQIEYSAATYKNHYNDALKKLSSGETLTMKINGKNIKIDNAATWAFYKYTPHFDGNKLFVDVYRGYFLK
jgi:hypothetical protein